MKRLCLLFSVLIFTACAQTTTPEESTTQPASTAETSSTTSTTPTETTPTETNTTNTTTAPSTESTSETTTALNANIVGTWQQDQLTLTVSPHGDWQLSGNINSHGSLQVAADLNNKKLLKLYGFNVNIDGIGNYFIAHFNDDSSQVNFGYLGTFNRVGQAETSLTDDTYMTVVANDPIDFSRSLLGTWTVKDKNAHYQNIWNYNPDGTFNLYADGRGAAVSGSYQVEYLPNNRIKVTYHYDDGTAGHVTEYTLSNGTLTEDGFENMAQIRNTDPPAP